MNTNTNMYCTTFDNGAESRIESARWKDIDKSLFGKV